MVAEVCRGTRALRLLRVCARKKSLGTIAGAELLQVLRSLVLLLESAPGGLSEFLARYLLNRETVRDVWSLAREEYRRNHRDRLQWLEVMGLCDRLYYLKS